MQADAWRSQGRCPEASAILEFLAGTLEPTRELEAHLDVCDECRRVVAAIGRSRLLDLRCEPPLPEQQSAPLGRQEDEAVRRVGSVLNDTYLLERLIGSGGMGWVYEAAHLRVPRRFAVKVLHRSSLAEDEAFERFRREAEIAGKLGHRNIVEVIDFNRAEDGTPYMVLELLEGEDLAHRIVRLGRLSPAQACEIFAQLCAGLAKAHARGIVHRDLKPQNVYLCREDGRDEVKILDFGISKLLTGSPSDTRSGAVLGTPRYMSPEQAQGRHDQVDARTDIFALGCILYECLTGQPAFDAPSVPSVLHAVCYEPHPALSSVVLDIRPAVEQVVTRALAKGREGRYASVEAFYDALQRASRARVVRHVEPLSLRGWWRRRLVGLGAGVAAVALAVALTWPESPPSPVAAEPAATVASSAPEATTEAAEPTAQPALEPMAEPTAIAEPAAETSAKLAAAPAAKPAPKPTAKPRAKLAAVQAERDAEPRTVEVHLQIDPSDASVELDGVMVTGNPLRLPLASGEHRIIVSAPGHEAATHTVGSDADSSLQVRLVAKPPPLEAGLPGPMEEEL